MSTGHRIKKPGPDDFTCKRCGKFVRYAYNPGARRITTFDAEQVKGAGFQLREVTEADDIKNTDSMWIADYVKVADRDPKVKAFRQHDCQPFKEGQ